jgi:hypothetical protein
MTRWLLVGAALLLTGCAEYSARTAPRPRTALEARAYQAYEACWNAGGPPTLDFVAIEEGRRLYAVMSHGFGSAVGQAKYDAVAACMAQRGITVTWGFPPSMMGGRRP